MSMLTAVGEAKVSHPQTVLITKTGGTRAGQQIYRDAAKAIKAIRLELIGKAPYRLKSAEPSLNRRMGKAVQGFFSDWELSGLRGEDGTYGYASYLRKQTSYLSWANNGE